MLTKEQILSITDNAVKEIEMPEWGGTVFIRGMNIEDQEFFQSIEEAEGFAIMISRFVCDGSGNLLFTDADIPALKKKSLQAVKRLITEIKAFSSLEEAEKNSDGTPA